MRSSALYVYTVVTKKYTQHSLDSTYCSVIISTAIEVNLIASICHLLKFGIETHGCRLLDTTTWCCVLYLLLMVVNVPPPHVFNDLVQLYGMSLKPLFVNYRHYMLSDYRGHFTLKCHILLAKRIVGVGRRVCWIKESFIMELDPLQTIVFRKVHLLDKRCLYQTWGQFHFVNSNSTQLYLVNSNSTSNL